MKYSFIFICQKGELEIQSMLLATSLRENLKCEYELIAALPVPEERWGKPSKDTLNYLENLGVKIKSVVNSIDPNYPIGNKVSCLSLEATGDIKIFLDSDILCLRPFSHSNEFNAPFCAKPVDLYLLPKKDELWEKIYSSFNLKMPNERIEATVSKELIPPYFNAGFIAVHNSIDFGGTWLKICKSIDSNPEIPYKRPWLDQLAIPIAVKILGIQYTCLDDKFNYPCHKKPLVKSDLPYFAHYHSPNILLKDKYLRKKVKQFAKKNGVLYCALSSSSRWSALLLPTPFAEAFSIVLDIKEKLKRCAITIFRRKVYNT